MDHSDIELGTPIRNVERRSRSGVLLSVRLTSEEAEHLERVANARHTTLSQTARDAIEAYCEAYTVAHPATPSPSVSATYGTSLILRYKEVRPPLRTFNLVRPAFPSLRLHQALPVV